MQAIRIHNFGGLDTLVTETVPRPTPGDGEGVGGVATLTDHESVGGRFEPDGSFRGTWALMTLECDPGTDESVAKKSEQRPPSETEVAALRRLADEVLRRVRS